ncbi:MAG: WYL domain-containing protein [Acidobacteriota bacterium]|nr:WYL domain-containing protein [Acidobacteriota bacterium]
MARSGAFKDRPLWRRLQTIHHEIKERKFPNASSLAQELGVSSKTVQRDLDYLRDELEAPIEFDRGENGYAYSRADYVLPFLPVDGRDLFSIGVAAQFLALFGGTPLGRDLKACYERLATLMPPAVRLRPEIVMERLALRNAAFRPVREETWEAVSEGLQRGRALQIQYHRPGAPPGDPRIIRPYSFVLSGRDWMVLAEDRDAGQVKLFYLARIESARLTADPYTIPRDFDPDRFFRNTFGLFVGDAKPFRLRVRFSPEVSNEIRELTFHPEQKIENGTGGEATLEMPAQSIKEARRFVLAWGKDAVVLEPPALIDDVRAELHALDGAYAGRLGKPRPDSRGKPQPARGKSKARSMIRP